MPAFDNLAHDWQVAEGAPSVSIAVLRRGKLLYAGGCGTGTPETVYQVASLGKHLVAALALLLAESGEGPALDALIGPYLPELPQAWGGITLRHLLSHTAGIPPAGYESLDLTRDYSDAEIAGAIAAGGALAFKPGTTWQYSNAGYVLAGIAIGRGAKAFYGDLLRDRIFVPLGMTTAMVTPPDGPVGYVRDNPMPAPASYVSRAMNRLADGGLCLSVRDFIRWEAALESDWGSRVAEMFTATRLDGGRAAGYGLGWFLSAGDYGRVAEHDGGWQGFSTAMVRYLDEGVTAVVLANIADADAAGLAHRLVYGLFLDGFLGAAGHDVT